MEARFRPQIQAPRGCEPLGALEYPIGWIEGPDCEDQLGARDDSPHPHHALRRLEDMDDSTYVLLPGNECAVRAGGGVEARFRPRIQAPHGCEPLGAMEYRIGWIVWPDYEEQLEVRNDSQHPHHALCRWKDMGDGLCPSLGQ